VHYEDWEQPSDDEQSGPGAWRKRWDRSGGRVVAGSANFGRSAALYPQVHKEHPRRRRYDDGLPHGFSARPVVINAIWWSWWLIAYFAYKVIINVTMPGVGVTHQRLTQFILRDVFAAGGGVWGLATFPWLWLAIGCFGSAVVWLTCDTDDMSKTELGAIILSFATGLTLFFGAWLPGIVNSDQDYAFNLLQPSSQVVCLHNPSLKAEHPSSMALVYSQNSPKKTAIRGADGQVDTVKIGSLTIERCDLPVKIWSWDERSSSFDAARRSLEQKTSTRTGVNVWESTISYAYGDSVPWGHAPGDVHPQTNRWTSVLDGSGYATPAIGAAEWEGGQNIPHTCIFGEVHNENNHFNRAFAGGHMNNLRNVIAGRYPGLLYQDSDVSGFCDQYDHPVFVIAVTRMQGYLSRAVPVPAGVLQLTGSPSGNPVIKYFPNVKAGTYPVSVYPLSIAQAQREVNNWWAGHGNNGVFGFATSSYASQADNSGEYVLRSKVDRGMYAVTPQRPDQSKSQEFVNVSQVRIDSVRAGHFNQLRSYVLPDDSKYAVNPSTLNSSAQAVLRASSLGATFHGVIKEFLPITATEYRGYGEDSNGSTVLYFDLPTQCGATATVVQVDPNSGGVTSTDTVTVPCGGNAGGSTVKGSVPVNNAACAGLNNLQNASIDAILACEQAMAAETTNRLKAQHGAVPSSSLQSSASPSSRQPAASARPSPSG
jgi:hypothetical protein